MTMSEESIELACDAGVPVLLAATRRAAPKLERLAEDLLVAGAEVEIVSDVEHAPCRFGEALVRLDRPAVIALCHTHDDLELAAVRAMIGAEPLERHRLVECHVDDRGGARTVLLAMRDLVRGAAEPSLAEVIDEVRKKGEPITETIVLPPKPGVSVAKKRRSAWAWGAGAAAMAATTIIAVVLATDPPAQPHGTDAMAATRAPAASTPTQLASPRAQTPVATQPLAISEPLVVAPVDPLPLVPAPTPKLELEAQGPAADAPDDLELAIRRGRALAIDGLVVHMVTGDRDWFHAMDTCRGRGFWGTSGWRVPSVAELRTIARTRSFPDRPAWSTRRGASDALAAVTVTLVGGATETVDKHAGDIATICVKSRA
ncbi:MAG TPA: hypothetical protein VG755_40690 [Nannocystaceae bacterium]|nr:hypothetical protein [Nannocystaceae bacterium]